MNTLLIYPEVPETFWSFKYAIKFINKKAAYPPLGLLTIASLLPKEWNLKLVDLNIRPLLEKDLRWADMVFISAMDIQKKSVNEIISRCKKVNTKVIAGGPLFSSDPKEYINLVDHLILNEAEITIPKFLRDLNNGIAKKIYSTDKVCDLQKSPAPRWDLINMNDYVCMSIQMSRGCPFNCEFCNVTALFGHKPRVKSVKQVINELDLIYKRNWKGRIFFVDDNFIGNKRFVKEKLLPAIIEWKKGKRGIVFNTQVSINIADDQELLQLMVEAGFDSVFIGIETPVDESLKECNKKQNRARDLIKDIRRIQNAGLEVQAGFIVGFDNDPLDIFQRQVNFIQESGIVTAMVGILQAPAGTKLYKRLKKEGRILGSITGDNVDGSTNIIPKMGMETLIRGYKYVMKNLYSVENYYYRVKKFLQEFKPNKIYEQVNKDRILGFMKANIKLGILGKERTHYWKTMLWTLLHKPKLFPFVVTFAIYGYHFRQICKKNLGLEL